MLQADQVQDSCDSRLVAILAFEDMEVLDYAGPYEVFNLASELSHPAGFEVRSVAAAASTGTGPDPVHARGGFTVLPDHTLADCPAPDLLVIPGGRGSRALLEDQRLLQWVSSTATRAELVLSVCTGALVLAAAGLLVERDATTHHGAFDELAALSPSTRIRAGQRFVAADQRLWTSGGVSAGVDLALEIVGRLAGESLKAVVADEMEWGWPTAARPGQPAN